MRDAVRVRDGVPVLPPAGPGRGEEEGEEKVKNPWKKTGEHSYEWDVSDGVSVRRFFLLRDAILPSAGAAAWRCGEDDGCMWDSYPGTGDPPFEWATNSIISDLEHELKWATTARNNAKLEAGAD
jgi:hypothetical protein